MAEIANHDALFFRGLDDDRAAEREQAIERLLTDDIDGLMTRWARRLPDSFVGHIVRLMDAADETAAGHEIALFEASLKGVASAEVDIAELGDETPVVAYVSPIETTIGILRRTDRRLRAGEITLDDIDTRLRGAVEDLFGAIYQAGEVEPLVPVASNTEPF